MRESPGRRLSVAARAVRHKLRAVGTLGTFWPAAVRGGKLLACGRFREFAGKLFNETATVRAADGAPIRSGLPLFLAGHVLRPGGYDHVVFALLKGLIEAGVNVHRDPLAILRPELIPSHLQPAEAARRPGQPRLAATPPHLLSRFRPDRRTVAFTMWETDTLPANAVRALNRCGLVVVPSRWGAECFRANGVTVPLEVVPLGQDWDSPKLHVTGNPVAGVDSPAHGARSVGWCRTHPIVSPECLNPHSSESHCESKVNVNVVVFGTAGALDEGGLRKNVQRVIDLFRRAFPTEAGVRLRVKISPASPPVRTHADPRIDVVSRSLSSAELTEWYQSLTVYVNGSFGEGFGLHLLEAMACGRPLISTTFGGASEFFDASVGYEVAYRLVEARNAIYSGQWADPDDAALMARMRQVSANPEEARQLGKRAATRAAGFTWDATARRLVEVLQRHGFA